MAHIYTYTLYNFHIIIFIILKFVKVFSIYLRSQKNDVDFLLYKNRSIKNKEKRGWQFHEIHFYLNFNNKKVLKDQRNNYVSSKRWLTIAIFQWSIRFAKLIGPLPIRFCVPIISACVRTKETFCNAENTSKTRRTRCHSDSCDRVNVWLNCMRIRDNRCVSASLSVSACSFLSYDTYGLTHKGLYRSKADGLKIVEIVRDVEV